MNQNSSLGQLSGKTIGWVTSNPGSGSRLHIEVPAGLSALDWQSSRLRSSLSWYHWGK
ncbi:hypothetical protein D9M68_625300 [compost metagenome]